MARTIVTTNTIFFMLVLFVLAIFFYNVLHFSQRLLEHQCEKTVKQKDELITEKVSQIAKLNERILELEEEGPPEVCSPDSKPDKPDKSDKLGDQTDAPDKPDKPPPQRPARPPSVKNTSPLPTIPVLIMACKRQDYLKRTLNTLFHHRPAGQFPVIVSQGCNDGGVAELLHNEYENKLVALKHHRRDGIESYFAIAQHYGWALGQVFSQLNYDSVIIVEDDMEISPDFFSYFSALYPILRDDPSLYCVSSWNDNGMAENVRDPKAIHRTDVFPGLGWMMTKDLWTEIGPSWPDRYWDEFMRLPGVRKGRQCLFAEISRNKNIGEDGTSKGQFWDKIARIKVNTEYVNFTSLDLSYLFKEPYDKKLLTEVRDAKLVSFPEVGHYENEDLRLTYDTIADFQNLARMFTIMDDEKEGMPRTSYKGIVRFYYQTNRIFLTPPGVENE